MSRAPYLLEKARGGYRLGHGELIDSVIKDGLWDVYNGVHMGTCGDKCAAECGFSRVEQDDFAVASYKRALAAQASGAFADEVAAVEVSTGKTSAVVKEDEQPKRFNEEKLRALRPAFGSGGTVTAGNASGINDGAAAVVALSAERARALSARVHARVLGYATVSREPEWFTLAPIGSIAKLLDRVGLKVAQVDLFEINEAFSVVTLAAMRELGIPHEKTNVNGGAVALGHPIGASGARTLVTLIHALRKRGAKVGVVSLCVGGGEAVAMAVEVV
jgi:acetyl-CoA C-acetyltransferase